MITLENITLYNTAIKNLSLSILPGAIIFIRGSKGRDKTSLLRLIAGLNTQYSGSYINKYFKSCYISNQLSLDLCFTVQETLMMWCELYNKEILLPIILKMWNLIPYKDVKIAEVSDTVKKKFFYH